MPWFRLDEGFHSHPKVLKAGNEATGLYVRCGTYAAEHLTDGHIPGHIAVLYGAAEIRSRGDAAQGGTETLGETLVRTKLWRRTRGGGTKAHHHPHNPPTKTWGKEPEKTAG